MFVQFMLDVCAEIEQKVCPVYVESLSCLCTKFVLFMYKVCHVYVESLSCLCKMFVLFMYKVCPVYVDTMRAQ